MLPLVGVEPRFSGFNALHVTVYVNSLFAGSLKTFRSSYSQALLIPRKKKSKSKNQCILVTR